MAYTISEGLAYIITLYTLASWIYTIIPKVRMQGKLFRRCAHFLYCSELSLGGKVNKRRMSQPDMESILTRIIYDIFWSLMHLFLFTNSAQRELVSICTQSIRDHN